MDIIINTIMALVSFGVVLKEQQPLMNIAAWDDRNMALGAESNPGHCLDSVNGDEARSVIFKRYIAPA